MSDITGLNSALVLPASGLVIVLEAGTYALTATLDLSTDITLAAEVNGTVVLDGGGARRVFYITGGTVQLTGLNITGGYAQPNRVGGQLNSVCSPTRDAPPTRLPPSSKPP